jgi:hypothetical protein
MDADNLAEQLQVALNLIDEKNRAMEEQRRAMEQKDRAMEEQRRDMEEQLRAMMQKDLDMEEQRRAIEDKDRAMEEKDRLIDEKNAALKKHVEENRRLLHSLISSELVSAIRHRTKDVSRNAFSKAFVAHTAHEVLPWEPASTKLIDHAWNQIKKLCSITNPRQAFNPMGARSYLALMMKTRVCTLVSTSSYPNWPRF